MPFTYPALAAHSADFVFTTEIKGERAIFVHSILKMFFGIGVGSTGCRKSCYAGLISAQTSKYSIVIFVIYIFRKELISTVLVLDDSSEFTAHASSETNAVNVKKCLEKIKILDSSNSTMAHIKETISLHTSAD